MFIEVSFTEAEVEKFKSETDVKNKLLNYNNLKKEFDTRWIGTACEKAFEAYIGVIKGLSYQYHAKNDRVDDRDFTIGEHEIDVKGVATSYYPKDYYACNIPQNQWEKSMREGNIINMFVFTRYLLHTNTVVLLGAISKERLKKTAQFFPEGTVRGKMTLNVGTWEIPISSLSPIERVFGS